MSEDLARYQKLERRLRAVRSANGGEESEEEVLLLDEMEETWLVLSDSEQAELRREPPRGWPDSEEAGSPDVPF